MHLRTLYRWGFQGEPVLASVIAVERHFKLAFDYVWVGDKGADPFPVSKNAPGLINFEKTHEGSLPGGGSHPWGVGVGNHKCFQPFLLRRIWIKLQVCLLFSERHSYLT